MATTNPAPTSIRVQKIFIRMCMLLRKGRQMHASGSGWVTHPPFYPTGSAPASEFAKMSQVWQRTPEPGPSSLRPDGSQARRLLRSPVVRSNQTDELLFRLQQTDNVAVGVGQPGEFTCGNGDRRHQRFAAERGGLVEISLQVVYLHVDRDVMMRLMTERGDVAVDAFAAGVDDGGGAGWCNVPVEKPAVKRLRPGAVTAADLEMHDRFSHFLFLPGRG